MISTEDYLPMVAKIAGDRASKCNKDFDDLQQEGVVALIEAINRMEEREDVKPITYLFHKVYWACYDYAYPNRKSKREPVALLANPEQLVVNLDEHAQVDAAEEVAFLVGRLSDKQREIVQLRSQGFKFEEIGEKLGFSKQRASAVYKETLKTLQESI